MKLAVKSVLKNNNEFKNPFHPGEVLLEEFLIPLQMTQSEFALKLGWTKAKLNELIRGKRGITAETAIDLSEELGTSAKLWMNMQSSYDLAVARKYKNKTA
jgi:antitoxin HigA-1